MATIVLAYDGSSSSRRALERAASLAEERDSVVVVGAVHPRVPGVRFGIPSDPADEADSCRDALDEARRQLFGRGLGARTVVRAGAPASVLTCVAREVGARLIVCGASIPRRPFLARSLARRASCPVEVVTAA